LSHKERCDLFGHNDSMDRDYSYSKWLDDNGYPKRAISLMWNQRSVDTFLGLPFNIASYGLLLTILAKEVNMVPDQLIGNLGDTHLYLNHIEQAKEQIGREPFDLPTLNQFPTYEGSRPSIESYVVSDFTLKDYQSHPSIKAPLSN
jgi:thymidylate synthase